jgi:hypothetical protein
VQDKLTTTRGEIEKAVADRQQLQDRAAYGSLDVTFHLPAVVRPAATPVPVKGWDPADDVARATGKLVRIGQATTSIGIWLAIVGLPLLVGAAGGFVAASKEQGAADAASATVDYRIPAAAWERTLTGLRGLATVQSQEIGTEEVTGKVIDLGARITNLRATEAALQAIMAKATKIEDVLDVQTELTDTRGEIEQLSAQKAQLEDRAAYGSLTVAFHVPAPPRAAPTPRAAPVWDPGKDVEEATAKLVRVGQRATTAGIWITIVGLPILVALAIALGIAWLVWRFISRRRTPTSASAAS